MTRNRARTIDDDTRTAAAVDSAVKSAVSEFALHKNAERIISGYLPTSSTSPTLPTSPRYNIIPSGKMLGSKFSDRNTENSRTNLQRLVNEQRKKEEEELRTHRKKVSNELQRDIEQRKADQEAKWREANPPKIPKAPPYPYRC